MNKPLRDSIAEWEISTYQFDFMTIPQPYIPSEVDIRIRDLVGGYKSDFVLKDRLRDFAFDIAKSTDLGVELEVFDCLIEWKITGEVLANLIADYYNWDINEFVDKVTRYSKYLKSNFSNENFRNGTLSMSYLKAQSPNNRVNESKSKPIKTDKQLMKEFIDSL